MEVLEYQALLYSNKSVHKLLLVFGTGLEQIVRQLDVVYQTFYKVCLTSILLQPFVVNFVTILLQQVCTEVVRTTFVSSLIFVKLVSKLKQLVDDSSTNINC